MPGARLWQQTSLPPRPASCLTDLSKILDLANHNLSKSPILDRKTEEKEKRERERERERVCRGSLLGVRSAPALWAWGASLRAWGWTRA